MENLFLNLVGLEAIRLTQHEYSVGIEFSSGDHVNIENRCAILDHRPGDRPGILKALDISDERVVFRFESGARVEVDFTDEGWRGPEAMNWSRASDGAIIVWN